MLSIGGIDMAKKQRLKLGKKQIVAALGFLLLIAFSVLVYFTVGKQMISFVTDAPKFREWVDGHGILGRLAFLGMMIFQMLVAIIPGEPLELGAGYAFGAIEGTLLCLIGAVLGGCLLFFLSRKLGQPFVELFFPKEKLESIKFLKSSPKRDVLFFIIFVIPGTPKDLLSYFVGLTDMSFKKWLLISFVGRIPSIVTSTISGNELGKQSYITAIIAFAVTAVISIAGIIVYKKICDKHEKKAAAERNAAGEEISKKNGE